MNCANAVLVKNLVKTFNHQEVIKNCSMTVPYGKIYGLLGANGAGKTTLMKVLIGLLKPTAGEIQVLGVDISSENKEYLSKIGSLIETPVFYSNLTVEENLSLHCSYLNKNYKEKISETLDLVGVPGIEKRNIKELSLGMKQRLAIGRSLLCEPELLILDEPINGVDPKGIIEIRNLLFKLNQERNITILISSHIINEIEKIADVVGIMQEGQFIAEISKEEFQHTDFNLENYFVEVLQKNSFERNHIK